MAACGPEIWDRAIHAGINLAMEASVCGGIPIHAVLREGISGDRVQALLRHPERHLQLHPHRDGEARRAACDRAGRGAAAGIRRGRSERRRRRLSTRARSWCILAALAFGEKITPSDIFMEGIRRISPIDFQYAHQLEHTIRLICARAPDPGRPDPLGAAGADSAVDTILAGVQGAYNAVWVKGAVRRGHLLLRPRRGPLPTGVAVVSDLMRVAREIRSGSPRARLAVRARAPGRVQAGLGHAAAARLLPALPRGRPAGHHRRAGGHSGEQAHQPGSRPAGARAKPSTTCRSSSPSKQTTEQAIREAVDEMSQLDFLREAAAGACPWRLRYEDTSYRAVGRLLPATLWRAGRAESQSALSDRRRPRGCGAEPGQSPARDADRAAPGTGPTRWASSRA